ncbi:MAG TPA: lysophospholipid acyltransferase family protein [Gemmatimonadales bacterium]|nr:lysophospholipid acyltransferase family protein [Gemmatimonadales bacterium]
MKLRWADPVLARFAAGMLRLLAASWRYRIRGAERLRAVRASGRPFVFVLWHSRILPLLYLHRHEDIVLLVSRHRDGAYLADLAARWGYRSVRGSSGRGGDVGLLGIVRALQAGATVAVTPDGPRGPAQRVKPGALAAAQHAAALLLPIGARPSAAWYLRSWDRFCIPKPFARVDVTYGVPMDVPPGKDSVRQAVPALERALREVTDGT